mmetsp:Transcript_40415/g.60484  ORF Transcript_40415/g.60484 Transcript_40415/m.60484 type:complete len:80 (-) Transcript_40415:283-522(-)
MAVPTNFLRCWPQSFFDAIFQPCAGTGEAGRRQPCLGQIISMTAPWHYHQMILWSAIGLTAASRREHTQEVNAVCDRYN